MQKEQSRILLRLTANIHAELKARAIERGRSINSLIEQYVTQGLNRGVDDEMWEALKKEAIRLYKKILSVFFYLVPKQEAMRMINLIHLF